MQSSDSQRRGGRLLSAALTAAALAVGSFALASPANAAPTEVEDATLTWGLNGYAQYGVFGPWTFKDLTGNIEYLPGASQTEYLTAPVPATSFPATLRAGTGPNANAVKFTDGTGTVDPDTGASTLTWTGSYTVNAYPPGFNAPDEIYANPELTIAADGSGELTVEFLIGAGVDMGGVPFDAKDFGRLAIATFSAGSLSGLDEDGFRLNPDFEGVTLDPAIVSGQSTSCTAPSKGGSWPAEFVETLASDSAGASIAPHFFTTGCGGMQDYKPALPVDIGFALADLPVVPEYDAGDIIVEVPEAPVAPETGSFGWAWASEDVVNLGTATQDGANFVASGALNDVIVTDTRAGGAGDYWWMITGQVSDFVSGANSFSGNYLGWSPKVVSGTADRGSNVNSAQLGDSGLGSAHELASSGSATSAVVGADLSLVIPGTTVQGDYKATLTLTAVH